MNDERAFDCPRPDRSESAAASSNGVRTGTSRRVTRESSNLALAACLALSPSAAHAHDRWDNGEPVPAWVKTECCGPTDAHHLRPDQVRRNAAGDYVVDIYPDPIPAHVALPSQDGDYWLFFYNDYGFYGSVRCFFVPALF